jgi:predicted RNase H-like nuclease (RuvC/YqgF family)
MPSDNLDRLAAGLAPIIKRELARELDQRDARIATLNAELAEIRRRLTALEQRPDPTDRTRRALEVH